MVNYELAKKSEKYVQNLAEKINRSLKGAELIQLKDHNMKRANLIIREPFIVDKKNYFNGFASVYVKFNIKPDFLNNEDYNLWYKKTSELVRKMFGIDWRFKLKDDSEYISIDFEESSEKKLYALTENKKETFKKGFDRVKRYAEWYCFAVNDYNEKVVKNHSKTMNKYLAGLEKLN